MNIVIAVHHFPPHFTGGTEWEVCRTAACLQRRGHTVRVICVEKIGGGAPGEASWHDETYEGIPVRRLHFTPAPGMERHRWEYDNPWIGERVRACLVEDRPAIFHLAGGYLISGSALRVAQELDIPTVVSLMDFWFLCPRIWMLRSDGKLSSLPLDFATCARCLAEQRRAYRWPGRFLPGLSHLFWRFQGKRIGHLEKRHAFLMQILRQVKIVIARSQFVRSIFVAAGINPSRIALVRQGCDFADTGRCVPREREDRDLKLGYIGQIEWHKGVHVLFQALRQMPGSPILARVHGSTSASPRYAASVRRAASKDSRISLAGACNGREEIRRAYRDLDVVVVPSLWPENCPNVILEAFAHGIPVVAANIGGIPELVRHESNGLLFERKDADGLARQLRRLLTEQGLLRRLSAGIESVKSVDQETDEIEALYRAAGHCQAPPPHL
jgi:glycosyltransferase involved in cell wall biosynthesis